MVRGLARLLLVGLLLACGALLPACERETPEPIAPPEHVVALDAIPAFSGDPFVEIDGNEPSFSEAEHQLAAFEAYAPLDGLGRCGTAFAVVGPETMPTEERGSIGGVKPSGTTPRQVRHRRQGVPLQSLPPHRVPAGRRERQRAQPRHGNAVHERPGHGAVREKGCGLRRSDGQSRFVPRDSRVRGGRSGCARRPSRGGIDGGRRGGRQLERLRLQRAARHRDRLRDGGEPAGRNARASRTDSTRRSTPTFSTSTASASIGPSALRSTT